MKRIVGWVGLLMVLGGLAPGVHATSSPKVTVQLIITNAQGSVVAKMTPDGVPTYSADYRPYGTTQSTPQAGPGYTGHVMDPTSGLVYMQQRYYDPATGRFISPDPVAPTPGNVFNFGRYTYANDNPIRFTDPDGRCAAYGSAQGLCKQAAQRAKKDQQIIDSGGSVKVFQNYAKSHGFHRHEDTSVFIKPVKAINNKKWFVTRVVVPGGWVSVDSLRIIIKPTSIAGVLPTNQFRYYVFHSPLSSNGAPAPSMSAPGSAKLHYFSSGFTGTGGWLKSSREFIAMPGPGGTRWFMKIPSQGASHGNASSETLYVYAPVNSGQR